MNYISCVTEFKLFIGEKVGTIYRVEMLENDYTN